MAAPSAVAKDPWEFIVVRHRDMLNRLVSGLPNGQMLADAALGIVVCGNLQRAHDCQLSYLLQDCSAAIENMLLAAQALGLGACWLGVHPRDDRIAHVRAYWTFRTPSFRSALFPSVGPQKRRAPHAVSRGSGTS